MNADPRIRLEDALHQAMAPQPAPESLATTLAAAARRQDQGTPRFHPRRWLAAAAVVALLAGGSAVVVRMRPAGPVRTAQGALRNYMEIHGLEFQGREVCADTCGRWSKARLGFEAPLPSACSGQPMRGGRACEVEGRPVAHYLLEDGRALYVFRDPIPGGEPRPGRALAVGAGLQAKAWNEEGRGYVMLEPTEPRR